MAQIQWKYAHIICYLELWEVKDLINSFDYEEYAYIQHRAEKEDLKEHIHIYLKFKNKVDIEHIAKVFGITSNLVFKVDKPLALLRYFLHIDRDKIQYNINELFTNIPHIASKIYMGVATPVSFDDLMALLKELKNNYIKFNTYNDFIFYLYEHNFGKYILKNNYFLHSFYVSYKYYETGYKPED